MGVRMLVHSVTDRALLTADEFREAVTGRFGSIAEEVGFGMPDTTFDVEPPGYPGYEIRLVDDARTLSTDGMEDQALEVVAWVRSLLPDDFPRVIVTDQAWGWHTELTPGITAEQILDRRIRHDETWSDPELESG